MTSSGLVALSPFILLAVTPVMIMLTIAFRRSHRLTVALTIGGLVLAGAGVCAVAGMPPGRITPLITVDPYALYYIGLVLFATAAISGLSYGYLEKQTGHREEYYLLLLIAALGCAVLAAAAHFVSFFLGIEILSVSLYALAAYFRHSDRSVEAGVKYLILAAVSSAFILFGMALVYAETGTMEFRELAARLAGAGMHTPPVTAGLALIIVGIGFKLAVVPFHMWTPDVYEGAPAPVTAFIATASKGAVFALALRWFTAIDMHAYASLSAIFTVIAIASMFFGNLLALLQTNVKRLLAYSSISHLGYLLVTLLASGPLAATAAALYLTAYFITTIGAFGVVTVLSRGDRDAELLEDYRGLAWRQPWLAGVFTAMLFSLAGIPLTAGFVGKFSVVAAGVGSSLWLPVMILIINSAIGLYYYLRIIVALFSRPEEIPALPAFPLAEKAVLAGLTVLLVWLGVFPGYFIDLIRSTVQSLI